MLGGRTAIGAVLGMGFPTVAGMMARSGFDFLLVDAQHGDWTLATAGEAFREIFSAGSIPMVRVTQNDPYAIGSMLDRGALGVVVPMVETASEARAAAESARYGPQGKRSVGGGGLRSWLPVSNDQINDEVFVAVQIESEAGVNNADAILSVEGVDGVWIGPSDLELSMGVDLSVEKDRRRHEDAIKHVLQACRNTGKIPGIAIPGKNNLWLEAGCLFVTVTTEKGCLSQGAGTVLSTYETYRQ